MAKKPKAGDVLEIVAPDGVIYVQYLGRHPEMGDAISVSPRVHGARRSVSPDLFADAYVTFYSASLAVKQGLAAVVGHLAAPPIPRRLRRPGAMRGTTVVTWLVSEDGKDVVKERLTEEELALPIESIWNHAFLIARVSKGWRPEHAGGTSGPPPAPAATPAPPPPADRPVPVAHYLYFPEEKAAKRAAERLREQGFTTEERLGADEVNWLVLATHRIVPSEATLAAVRTRMENLAREGGGEYDGWEAETGRAR